MGKPAETARQRLKPLSHSFTLDWLLGFSGPREEAEAIKGQLKVFLRDTLKLTLSEEKTLITQARTASARFLGYEVVTQQADDQHCRAQHRRCINGALGLKCAHPERTVIVGCGEHSRSMNPERSARVAERLPHGHLEVWPRAGHFGPLEDPDTCARSILSFTQP